MMCTSTFIEAAVCRYVRLRVRTSEYIGICYIRYLSP